MQHIFRPHRQRLYFLGGHFLVLYIARVSV
jgi:hypothetical protein